MENIIIFGAGSYGKKVYDFYKEQGVNILCFCDNDKNKTFFCNEQVITPNELTTWDFHKIIIASSYEKEIEKQLESLSIEKGRYTVFSSNYETIQFKNNQDKLVACEKLMFDLATLFNQNQISYHLDHGTLLGIIRNSQILPWDIDIDFAAPEDEKQRILEVLDKYIVTEQDNITWLYEVKKQILDQEKNSEFITLFNKDNSVGLDIHFKYQINENLYWTVGEKKLHAKAAYCFPSKEVDFKGHSLKIPSDFDGYLTQLYGNWRVEDREWDYSKYSNIDVYNAFNEEQK